MAADGRSPIPPPPIRERAGEPNCARHHSPLQRAPCPPPGQGSERGSGQGIEPGIDPGIEPGRAPVLHLVLCHRAKAPGAPKDGAGASHPASSDATGSCGEGELATAWIDQPPVVALASTLAQLSRSPTVRLKMSRPGTDSGSRQK